MHKVRGRSGVRASALAAMLAGAFLTPAVASADEPLPVPVAPVNGQVFMWEGVYGGGIPLTVQAPAGLGTVSADVARDAAMTRFADYVPLFEASPGRYEGTALTLLL